MKKNVLLIVGGIVLVLAVVLWQLFANPKIIVANAIEKQKTGFLDKLKSKG